MIQSLSNSSAHWAYTTFRALVPATEDRIPYSVTNVPLVLAAFLPFVYLAYLARRPNTYLLRLLILPIVLTTTLTPAFRYYWTIPSLNVYNWAQCLLAEVLVAKALEYALTPEGMLKLDETSPGVSKAKPVSNGVTNGHLPHPEQPQQRTGLFPRWLADAFELIHTMRGLQWKFAQGTYIPKYDKNISRSQFIKSTISILLINFFIFDFLESIIKLFPGVGTVEGGSMFYPSLPPLQRYAVATTIHMIAGMCLLAGFGMVYNLLALLAVAFCDSSPAAWPPTTGNPWMADSLHQVWAKEWHQFLRRTFLVCGGIPGKWIAGNIGMLFGTFVASALFHECAAYHMGKGVSIQPVIFFLMQAPLLIGERLWSKATGRRVSGWPGRLWVYAVMFIGGQPMVDSWFRRGLGGAMLIPPFISPSRILILRIVGAIRASQGQD